MIGCFDSGLLNWTPAFVSDWCGLGLGLGFGLLICCCDFRIVVGVVLLWGGGLRCLYTVFCVGFWCFGCFAFWFGVCGFVDFAEI